MKGILRDTYLELIDRRLFVVYIIITALAALVMFLIDFSTFQMTVNGVKEAGFNIVAGAISRFVEILVFLTVMASAGLIPSMMVKGRIDFYLSRPVSRTFLYLNRLFSIWIVYGGLFLVSTLVIILVAWLRTDALTSSIIYLPLIQLLELLIWFSITCCVGVMTGSTPMVIMAAFLVWVAQFILSFHESALQLFQSEMANMILTSLYHIVPKTGEISALASDLVAGHPANWQSLWSSMIVTGLIILIGLGLFKRKNF